MRAIVYLPIAIRVLVALCTRTFFQPDEYFQALEPAYHFVFGYGHLTWEWTTPQPIRSIIYPALNIPIYWVLKYSGLSTWTPLGDFLLIAGPKLVHGLLASLTDIWICEIARSVLGRAYVSTALFLSLTSFFNALSLSRSLSNSLETSLATIAFAYFPWDASSKLSPQLLFNRSRIRRMILFSALACMIRPTNAVVWAFLYANLIWSLRGHKRIILVRDILFAVIASNLILFTLDSLYYKKPTFTAWNFLRTNLSSVSLFYGSNPWHYYVTQAIPVTCTTTLPFALHGIWRTLTSSTSRDTSLKTMLATIVWAVSIYSLAGHKEWRFIHPILPLLQIFAAKSLVDLASIPSERYGKKFNSTAKSVKDKKQVPRQCRIHYYLGLPAIPTHYLLFTLLTIPASLYVVLFYCSAPISVMSYIRAIPRDELGNSTVGFLMPCHSTPGQAYMHRAELAKGGMWTLGCEPPLEYQELSTYKDQTAVFFDSPSNYLASYFPKQVNAAFPASSFPASIPGTPSHPIASGVGMQYPWRHEWPKYLVFFGQLLTEPGVRGLLENRGYKEVWRAGRTWEGEGKRKGGVKVWKWIPS